MGLLPDSAVVSGSIRLDGRELVGLADSDYCKLRGNRISMIFQEPMTALNPMHTIGRQVAEPLRAAQGFFGGRRRASRRSRCSTASDFPMRRSASMPIRTSFPAASASASPSRWRWPASPTC